MAIRATSQEVRIALGEPHRVKESEGKVVWFYNVQIPRGPVVEALFFEFDQTSGRMLDFGRIVKSLSPLARELYRPSFD